MLCLYIHIKFVCTYKICMYVCIYVSKGAYIDFYSWCIFFSDAVLWSVFEVDFIDCFTDQQT
jgi:hypothetical protein